MNFDQKIKYLDYLEADVRVRGAGFLRLECWGTTCNLIMQASGLFEVPNGSFPVMLCSRSRERRLCDLRLELGKGRLELRGLSCENLLEGRDEMILPVREVEKLTVMLGGERKLVAILNAPEERQEDAPTRTAADGLGSTMPGGAIGTAQAKQMPGDETGAAQAKQMPGDETGAAQAKQMPGDETGAAQAKQMPGGAMGTVQAKQASGDATGMAETTKATAEKSALTEEITAAQGPSEDPNEKNEAQEPSEDEQPKKAVQRGYLATIKPGKWEQLMAIYPPIAPFGDSRRYLQISPGDFVILKDRSYRMVNNSFLLHGYFTYKHLILHKTNRKGEAVYYVGVPGSFYNKEKEVAILFGFESFEGATEPAREGDFGYYMMRVEL